MKIPLFIFFIVPCNYNRCRNEIYILIKIKSLKSNIIQGNFKMHPVIFHFALIKDNFGYREEESFMRWRLYFEYGKSMDEYTGELLVSANGLWHAFAYPCFRYQYCGCLVIASIKDQIPKQLLTSKDTAKKLYAALVTAILTMTTISFSVIMVVLTTYSTQFSPRTLQDFMRSRTTQHVLGIYCFGFIFALLLLIFVDHGNPVAGPFIMAGIAIVCLAFFVYFIHHSARWIQVNNLIAKIRMDGSSIIKYVFKKEKLPEYSVWDEEEINRLRSLSKTVINAKHSGYVQEIRWNGMVEWAKKHDYVIDLHV